MTNPSDEAHLITQAFFDQFGTDDTASYGAVVVITAEDAILEMQTKDFHWKQMEWPGWFLKMKLQELPVESYGTRFKPLDYGRLHMLEGEYVWDIRFNPYGRAGGIVPFMSYDNLQQVLEDHNGVGLLIANCIIYPDTDWTVFQWHEDLKGGSSDYTQEIESDPKRHHRRRKAQFFIKTMHSFFFTSNDFETGVPWLGDHFQGSARAPGGTSREYKPEIYPEHVPNQCKIDVVRFNELPFEEEPFDEEYIP